jgi:hypothetical protein
MSVEYETRPIGYAIRVMRTPDEERSVAGGLVKSHAFVEQGCSTFLWLCKILLAPRHFPPSDEPIQISPIKN